MPRCPIPRLKKALALSAKQVFKDFKFSINDGYGAEADKILQMGQNLQPSQEFLTQIGAWQWYVKRRTVCPERALSVGRACQDEG